MKIKLTIMMLLFGIGASNAQNQTIDGDFYMGLDAGPAIGRGKTLYFQGVQSNSDEMYITRFNRAVNESDLRINIGDDFGTGGDRFVIGTHYWLDNIYHPHFMVASDGKVGIGIETIGEERLAVNGKIRAKEIKVETANWPDYVFEDDYKIISLQELEKYIKERKHLPEMPTAKEVEAGGVELGEMNKLMLKKIEELTLYLIEKDRQLLDALKRISELEKKRQ